MKLLNDDWTYKIENLGYTPFAERLCNLLLNAQMPSAITIGGRWGAGKTSMLRFIMQSLGGEPPSRLSITGAKAEVDKEPSKSSLEIPKEELKLVWTVWFNPWQYQNEENPVIPLLHEIRSQIKNSKKLKQWLNDENGALDALEAGFYSMGNLIDDAVNFSLGRKTVTGGSAFFQRLEKSDENRKQKNFTEPVNAQHFYLQFEKAVQQIVGKNGRLLIFIDDLDRCSDQTVFSLLESIKLYLSCNQCIFIFGLDRIHIESALQQAAGYNMDEARQYIEKLFQAGFYLPKPKTEDLEKFIHQCLIELKLDNEEKQYHKTLIKWLPNNPRVIKTSLNGLALYHAMLDDKLLADDKWILVHLFRVFYPDVYELLLQNPEDIYQVIKKIMGQEIDLSNQLEAYIYYILENPIKHSPAQDSHNGKQMKEERFRKIRANAWQAETQHEFLKAFIDAFHNKTASLNDYLI